LELAGGTLSYKDQELTLYRHGGPEQVWMDLDYSPVLDEDIVEVGDLGPALPDLGAKQLRMAAASEDGIRVIVEHDAVLAPQHHDGYR
jgi:hypothetical protein